MRIFLFLTAIALTGLALLGTVFVAGMRAKWPPVIDGVRRLNRSYFASQQLESAGTPGASAGALRHTGRKSGNSYTTPLGIKGHGDDFVIAIVYGRRTDWLQNVMAAGSAFIEFEGESYTVDRPEIVPMAEVAGAFPPGDQRWNRLLAIDESLLLHRVSPEEA